MKLKYKRFIADYEFYKEDSVFAGKVLNIDDLISFESSTEEAIQKEFEFAVHDYIETCKEIGKEILLK